MVGIPKSWIRKLSPREINSPKTMQLLRCSTKFLTLISAPSKLLKCKIFCPISDFLYLNPQVSREVHQSFGLKYLDIRIDNKTNQSRHKRKRSRWEWPWSTPPSWISLGIREQRIKTNNSQAMKSKAKSCTMIWMTKKMQHVTSKDR